MYRILATAASFQYIADRQGMILSPDAATQTHATLFFFSDAFVCREIKTPPHWRG